MLSSNIWNGKEACRLIYETAEKAAVQSEPQTETQEISKKLTMDNGVPPWSPRNIMRQAVDAGNMLIKI